jgi:energy-coupling factor transporter ATP-binding protein EcfA2
VGARRPESGQVQLGDHDLYAGGQTDLDHGLALLAPQFPEYLFTRSTVVEELRIDPGLIISDQEEFLSRLGLPLDIGFRNPHSLSSGQKRRLALGMVLFSGRPLLLLDEPTAALDHAGKRLVRDLVKQVPRETAILVASHDRDFLADLGCSCLDLGAFTP